MIANTKSVFASQMTEIQQASSRHENLSNSFNTLCNLVISSTEKIWSLQEATQHNFLKILALQKDQEINNIKRDALLSNNSDRLQSLETKSSCSKDMQKVWVTFTCNKELESLKSSNNLIDEAKKIFKRMDIDVNRMGMMPIKSANIQHIKVKTEVIPTLCVSFTNEKIAAFVRKSIIQFNARLEEQGLINDMRYCEKIYWSKDVWKLLRICWELRRVGLIESARVHSDGIYIKYKKNSNDNSFLASLNVTCFDDLDYVRKIVKDVCHDSPCSIVYYDNYFHLSYEERDASRSGDTSVYDDDLN
jgi:hypothetical protein